MKDMEEYSSGDEDKELQQAIRESLPGPEQDFDRAQRESVAGPPQDFDRVQEGLLASCAEAKYAHARAMVEAQQIRWALQEQEEQRNLQRAIAASLEDMEAGAHAPDGTYVGGMKVLLSNLFQQCASVPRGEVRILESGAAGGAAGRGEGGGAAAAQLVLQDDGSWKEIPNAAPNIPAGRGEESSALKKRGRGEGGAACRDRQDAINVNDSKGDAAGSVPPPMDNCYICETPTRVEQQFLLECCGKNWVCRKCVKSWSIKTSGDVESNLPWTCPFCRKKNCFQK